MQSLLEENVFTFTAPNCCSTDFATFTDKQVTLPKLKLCAILFIEVHLPEFVQFKITPLNVEVGKIRKLAVSGLSPFIEHFA